MADDTYDVFVSYSQALKMQAAKDRRVAKLQARVELLETRIRDLSQGKKRGG